MRKIKYAIIVPNYNNDHGSYKDKTYLRTCIKKINEGRFEQY